jgi:glyoxylase-like metal-dependent hydrolase (beta-lactamase superfamily II)/rhodanese-related sulfurtransferase
MDDKKVSASELQEMLNNKQNVFILDVRPTDQRNEWQIAESTHLDAYKRLNSGDNTVLDEVDIPKDATVVTVCAAGRTSLIASEALREKGIRAYSLDGGMKAWNYAWNKAEVSFPSGLKIIQVRRPAKGVLSYVIGSANEAIVVDAALDPQVYQQLAKENGWTIKYVTDTHIHADYVSRTKELAIATNSKHLLIDRAVVEYSFTPISNRETINVGNSRLEFLHTPGHTLESTTIKVDVLALITGDTLFIDGVGRPDLKANEGETIIKAKQLHHSLNILFSFPASLLVLPAHTSKAVHFDGKIIGETLSSIKEQIDLLRLEEKEFVKYTLTRIPTTPPNYLTIASLNKKGSHEGQQLADLEAGGNHCAIG